MEDFYQTAVRIVRLYLLIPLLFVATILTLVLIAVGIAYVRILRRNRAIALAEKIKQQERFRPDGLPYPPCKRGMCDACVRPFEKVYYLPSGQRLCPECYQTIEMPLPATEISAPAEDTP